ncbi:hypothetical protein ES703_75059 [subsurface metagenome]
MPRKCLIVSYIVYSPKQFVRKYVDTYVKCFSEGWHTKTLHFGPGSGKIAE